MKERLIGFIKTYCLFVGIFALQKPLFMLLHFGLYKDCSPGEWLAAMWYGLPLDLSLAGYLTAIPGLFYICSVWKLGNGLRRVWCAYFGLVSVLLSAIFVIDTALYEYWGFRLDTTPFFYFFSSPKDALASGSLWLVAGGMLGMAFYALVIYACFRSDLLRRRSLLRMKMPYRRLTVSFVLLLFLAALFIPIRGGFSVSTMNTGKVYFSTNQRLNHAAINPAFSLMESISKQTDFASQYRFMDAAEADSLFDGLLDPQARQMRQAGAQPAVEQMGDSLRTLLSTSRPDVLFIVLEGFSSHLMGILGGQQGVAVCLDSLSREGVLFTNFYANSFRTDRGLVAILSGYPAQPTTSIMKYPRKTQSIPSIAGRLAEEGYRAEYYYGGDADFTNMRSYLKSSGFERIVCDKDFPVSQRLSKWGAHDHLVFDRLLDDMKQEDTLSAGRQPRFRVLQTSSSHEPFEVPYRRLADDRLNAFAYTDSCVGDFIQRFRQLPQWHNTLVVLVPDHLGAYPENLSTLSVERYQIPLLLVGGAVAGPKRVDVYGSQQDIAATLLAQMGLPHGEFTFSKDLMDPAAPHFGFFTVPDAFGMVTEDNRVVFDCQSGKVSLDEGTAQGRNLPLGKAYLQKLYDDVAAR